MTDINLWAIERNDGKVSARTTRQVENTETEEFLEDLLVSSPQLIEPGLNLVGRQVACQGGYIDLLAIDQDGRITILELKRGVLTRDAVAQLLDYASDLASYDTERFARLVEESAGRLGIPPIEDFPDWYSQEYPNASDALSETPRLLLVGLGVDDRARRIVRFLAESGVEVQLLTFYGFEQGGQLLLARQVEVSEAERPSRDPGASITKEGNREILHQKATELGLKGILEQARTFIEERLSAYCWPGKTAYSFSLQEKTSEGRPTLRTYVTLYVQAGPPPRLLLMFTPRAVAAAGPAVDAFCASVSHAVRGRTTDSALEVGVRADEWTDLVPRLEPLLAAIVAGWQKTVNASTEGA